MKNLKLTKLRVEELKNCKGGKKTDPKPPTTGMIINLPTPSGKGALAPLPEDVED